MQEKEFIPLAQPTIDEDDINSVLDVLNSKRLAMGPKTKEFEEKIASLSERKYAVATSSGTAALHLGVISCGIKTGDIVITTPFSFVASANVILYQRAIPVFVDIDESTFMPSADSVISVIEDIKKGGYKIGDGRIQLIPNRLKAVLMVDIFGFPFEWDRITNYALENNLKVIEDSCEALGSEYKGLPCGKFGDVSAFAFYPNKQITTGEGGVLLTDDENIYKMAKSLCNQGRGEDNKWLLHVRLGYNYRIDEMSAALGVSQLGKLDLFVLKRQEIANYYTLLIEEANIQGFLPPIAPLWCSKISWFVYVVLLPEYVDRDKIMLELGEMGIETRPYFTPIHLQPFYRDIFGYKEGCYPVTEAISSRCLALPFFVGITPIQQERVVETLVKLINKHKK